MAALRAQNIMKASRSSRDYGEADKYAAHARVSRIANTIGRGIALYAHAGLPYDLSYTSRVRPEFSITLLSYVPSGCMTLLAMRPGVAYGGPSLSFLG